MAKVYRVKPPRPIIPRRKKPEKPPKPLKPRPPSPTVLVPLCQRELVRSGLLHGPCARAIHACLVLARQHGVTLAEAGDFEALADMVQEQTDLGATRLILAVGWHYQILMLDGAAHADYTVRKTYRSLKVASKCSKVKELLAQLRLGVQSSLSDYDPDRVSKYAKWGHIYYFLRPFRLHSALPLIDGMGKYLDRLVARGYVDGTK
jgi:hypothetical protein